MSSIAYDTHVSAMFLKSLETKAYDTQVSLYNIIDKESSKNETNKIIEMLSKIIIQNEKIQEKLEKIEIDNNKKND